MQLSKYHGLGNDFLVTLTDEVPDDGADLARRLCHRTRGIGADGLIFGTGLTHVPGAAASAAFNLFNSDGSSAEISGNGMRCFAHAVARALNCHQLTLEASTPAGERIARVETDETMTTATATVDMGAVMPLVLPADRERRVGQLISELIGSERRWATADIGNPHIVIEVDAPDAVDLSVVGPALEAEFMAEHGGINVHVVAARQGSGPAAIDLRVWERGSGITEACGSGACAAGAVAAEWGIATVPVTVHMPGGSAVVGSADTAAQLTLSGPSVFVADIEAA
jgi:diaminopimelate epimerase